jgi:hypothetical protein
MGYVPLRDALGLLALYAAEDSPKYEKAARRWLGRLALESDDVPLAIFSWPRQRCRRSPSVPTLR